MSSFVYVFPSIEFRSKALNADTHLIISYMLGQLKTTYLKTLNSDFDKFFYMKDF